MDPTLDDQNFPEDIIKMPEMLSNQPLTTSTTMEDMNSSTPRFIDPLNRIDGIQSMIDRKQKSLISVYDNNPQQASHSFVGIIGRNQRAEAFTKRLLLSGLPKPILCDVNSTEINPINYVSFETFDQYSPSIVLITESLPINFEDLFPQNKQQLIIDTREISSLVSPVIPSSYRAFGNLSNWEIANGTSRIGVAIEQFSPSNLIKFISDLKCFPRGTFFLDHYSYDNQQIRSFHNCLFPLITTGIIFVLYLMLSILEHDQEIHSTVLIYRQSSSITAATSITLLALVFLVRPLLELIEWIYSMRSNHTGNIISHLPFLQTWLQSRRYLSWYSFSFALLHLLFLVFSKLDSTSIYAFFFGILALILLCTLSFVHFSWISERLLWNEYRFFTSYIGPFTLLLAFIHLYLYCNFQSTLLSLKFLSMILPLMVLILRLIISGILHPIQWFRNRRLKKNTSSFS